MEKHWTVAEIDQNIQTSTKWLTRAIVALMRLQTKNEMFYERTTDRNGVGFNAPDAKLLTTFGKQIERGVALSDSQMIIARRRIRKYCRQLCRIANKASVDRTVKEIKPAETKVSVQKRLF